MTGRNYCGRPTSLYFAENLSKTTGEKIYLKREDLTHMGAHKINNTLGQALLAVKMGKKNIVAETGAGQHGVASATVAAKFGLKCTIFMGENDIKRQQLNVKKIKLLGAEIVSVSEGSKGLKEAVDKAIEYWIQNIDDSFYMLGSAVGPHPYPEMVAYFQSVIGKEAKNQIIMSEGKMPDRVVACAGGGSNALGIFSGFLDEKNTELVAVEAGGKDNKTGNHSRTLEFGETDIIHGMKTLVLFPHEVYSIAPGLAYPGISPMLSFLVQNGRVKVGCADDIEALNAMKVLAHNEGIIPAIESSHALAYVLSNPQKGKITIVNVSGRGDKDLETC
jgi:tryptophan synthase beta chain